MRSHQQRLTSTHPTLICPPSPHAHSVDARYIHSPYGSKHTPQGQGRQRGRPSLPGAPFAWSPALTGDGDEVCSRAERSRGVDDGLEEELREGVLEIHSPAEEFHRSCQPPSNVALVSAAVAKSHRPASSSFYSSSTWHSLRQYGTHSPHACSPYSYPDPHHHHHPQNHPQYPHHH